MKRDQNHEDIAASAPNAWQRNMVVAFLIVVAIAAPSAILHYVPFGVTTATEKSHPESLWLRITSFKGSDVITPIPANLDFDENKVELGRWLFEDTRLSSNGEVACASCHRVDMGGDDNLTFPIGVEADSSLLNTPTILNSALNNGFFWDGHAKFLEDQFDGPLTNPAEMGSSWDHVLDVVRSDKTISEAFTRIYGAQPTVSAAKNALAEYVMSLLTPDAPFDRYLRGDETAISADAKAGYGLFQDLGCATCHQGMNVGGNLYQKLGVFQPYFVTEEDDQMKNWGLYNVTGRDEDKFIYRVPGLRNVALTAPYLHDGSVETLDETIRIMALYQLGYYPDDEEVRLLVAFLSTLNGVSPHELAHAQ